MHELSIALSIIDLVEKEVRKNGSSVIQEVELEIGELSGVELQALDTALECAVKNTALEQARMTTHVIRGQGYCNDCETTFPKQTRFAPCPHCGSYLVKITQGTELRVKSIVVE